MQERIYLLGLRGLFLLLIIYTSKPEANQPSLTNEPPS
ncbi:Uncharacterised protein [Legionella cincinnatiensis]|uniref:Uncharacterized protein n=1 Tax=Legionella cincinnatiensis TaxID=28085 RepID=A0A378IKF3_9GAMM|nr:Uncharacterised protein [Legionella cincinnatiensis]